MVRMPVRKIRLIHNAPYINDPAPSRLLRLKHFTAEPLQLSETALPQCKNQPG